MYLSKPLSLLRFTIFTMLAMFVMLSACRKEKPAPSLLLSGQYKGTFERTSINTNQLSNVTIDFAKNTWSGQSEYEHYPALCHGAYSIENDMIHIENGCPWTAGFDWSLVLSGNYHISSLNDTLQIWREYNNQMKDMYKLVKQ